MQFLIWVMVGLVAGWFTGKKMKGYGYGPMIDMLMGGAGGIAGGLIMNFAGFSGAAGTAYATLVAILTAVGMTAFVAFVSGKQRYA